jgi:hypothetical protein
MGIYKGGKSVFVMGGIGICNRDLVLKNECTLVFPLEDAPAYPTL